MLKLLLGRNQTQLTDAILRAAAEYVPGRRSLVIVPEQYSHVTERQLCAIGGDEISGRAEVLTFSRLAQRVFQELGGSARPTIDQGGRLLLMHLAVRRMSGQLQIYRQAGEKAGFLTELISTADECKSYCISPEMLLTVGENAGDQGQRLRELGLILGAYDALIKDRAEDPQDKLSRLAETLRGTHYFSHYAIFLNGFTDFTPQERLVLASMLRQGEQVTAALRCDVLTPEGESVFEPMRHTGLILTELARENGVAMEYRCLPIPEQLALELSFMEKQLFSTEQKSWPHLTRHIELECASDPYEEAERAANRILYLVQKGEVRFRDITVAVRDLSSWSDRIERVFAQYGIPVFLSKMDDILQKPVLTLLTSALDTVNGGYEYDDMFRYLKTGLTGLAPEERDELENYVLCWDIRGSRWTAEKPWSWHPGGYGQSWTDSDREKVMHLDALRRKIVMPLEHLRKQKASSGGDWAKAVYAFLEEIDLPACLTKRAAQLYESGALREADEYCQVWQVLIRALEQCSDLLGEDRMTMRDFADLFQLVLGQYQVGTIPVSLDRVTCSDMTRISYGSCRVLFLLGADDESMPLVGGQKGLFTESDRRLLAELGMETALNQDQRMDREMMLIYECFTMPTDLLHISYAKRGVNGREKRPSFVVHRLQELFPQLSHPAAEELPAAFIPALEVAAQRGDRTLLAELAELDKASAAGRALNTIGAKRENLTQQAVQELYHSTFNLSASRMDKVKSCHYAYFLQYGLKARARRPAGLDAPEAGTFIHYIMEHVLSGVRENGGVSELVSDQIHDLCRQYTEEYIRKNLGGLEDKTPRFRYLFRRLAQSSEQIVAQMVEEIRSSDFQPIAFELGFGRGESLPPVHIDVNGMHLSITGFVDRVDGWEHNGRLYIRVVDYKTGRKSFDLTDIWHGLNLQMLLYLFTLQEKGIPNVSEPVVPAGVLYLPAREEQISGSRSMDELERRKELDKKLRRSGLILNDPNVIDAMEHVPLGCDARFLPVHISKKTGAISGDCLASAAQLGKLHRHIHRILRDIAMEIGKGDIQADPWYRDERHTACAWCDYASACHFEDGQAGERRRYLYPVKGTDFWEQISDLDEQGQEGGR